MCITLPQTNQSSRESIVVRDYKCYLDKITDTEDELQRMVPFWRMNNMPDASFAANEAATALVRLAEVIMRYGPDMPLLNDIDCGASRAA